MRIIRITLAAALASTFATAAPSEDKCAALINKGSDYYTCRMSEAQNSANQMKLGTRNNPAIGLSYDDVVRSFNRGKPLVCNSTKTRAGEHLQCWYPDRVDRSPTMYFDNGELTSVQNF